MNLLVKCLQAQGKHSDVAALSEQLARFTPQQLAIHHPVAASLLYECSQSAQAVKETNLWLSLTKQELQLAEETIRHFEGDGRVLRLIQDGAVVTELTIGAALFVAGRQSEAIEYLKSGSAHAQEFGFKPQSPDIAAILGWAQVFAGEVAKGIVTLERAIDKLEDSSRAKLLALSVLRVGYTEDGKLQQARATAKDLQRLALSAGDIPSAIGTLNYLANMSYEAGDFALAKDSFSVSLAAIHAATNILHLEEYDAVVGVAKSACRLGEFEETAQAIIRARRLLPKVMEGESLTQSNRVYAGLLSVESALFSTMQRPDLALKVALERNTLLIAHAQTTTMPWLRVSSN